MTIRYKDAAKEDVHRPFCFQVVLTENWLPLAAKLDLPLLAQLDALCLRERSSVEELIGELEKAREYLANRGCRAFQAGERDYMIQRTSEVLTPLREAVEKWDQVEEVWFV